MKVLFACGGTGGHINPAIAIADYIKANDSDAEITFVGTSHGIENKLVANAGYELMHVEMRGLKRKLSLSNILTAYYYITAPFAAWRLLKKLKPDIVVGTGGYACWPVLHEAAKMHIPTALHESNAIPGKAVKMLGKSVDRIYINFKDSAHMYQYPEKLLHVGNPMLVKSNGLSKRECREKLGIPAKYRQVILSFGGSMGAEQVNFAILDFMRDYTSEHPDVLHIHATGSIEYHIAMNIYNKYELSRFDNIILREYIFDMPLWQGAADLVISRAGAMTLSEMALMKKPCILIPSPNVANNHQYENAKVLSDRKAAIMIEEKELDSETLEKKVCEILGSSELRREMSENISAFAVGDACKTIYEDMKKLIDNA